MCGITGYFSNNNAYSKAHLTRMTDVLSHRGPDAHGYFTEGKVGLGHRRLSILDLSEAANQPMFSHDNRYVISFNGEIYNYREIADELKLEWRTTCDTEVILEAFVKWGVDFVHKLNGMFTIAIYDKSAEELWLFRDRIGIKPLFYFYDQTNLVFASELKAINAVVDGLELDKTSIYHFLHLGYVPQPHTIYKKVFKLPAGSFMKMSDFGMTIKHFWNPDDYVQTDVLTDKAEAKSRLRDLIIDAVDKRLISDVPIGTFLSGGIDSSLVTAVAQSIKSEPVNTFSIGFRESQFNEAGYAGAVAKHLKTNHHEFIVTDQDAMELVDDIVRTYDEPFLDGSSIPTMLVSKLARQHVTVALSGDGGDELFHGYGAYKWARRLDSGAISFFRKPIKSVLERMSNRYQRVSTMFSYENGENIRSHIFSQEHYLFNENELDRLLHNAASMEAHIDEAIGHLPRKLNPAEHQAFIDLKHYLKDDLLVKVDRASMKYGLEVRVPLLDHRIVEFALNLSPRLKIRNGEMKYLLKQVLYDYVPESYFARPKWGFAIPLQVWLKQDLRYLLDDFLSEKCIEKHGLVNYAMVDELKKAFFSGRDYLFNRIWSLIVLHKWLEQDHNVAV